MPIITWLQYADHEMAPMCRSVTTVELIVEEADWTPPPPPLVRVKVEYWEVPLRREVKAAGGRWDPKGCVWLLPLDRAQELGLERRISPV